MSDKYTAELIFCLPLGHGFIIKIKTEGDGGNFANKINGKVILCHLLLLLNVSHVCLKRLEIQFSNKISGNSKMTANVFTRLWWSRTLGLLQMC